MKAANSHTPDVTPPEESIAGCQQQGCPVLGLCCIELPGLGKTYLCPTHLKQAERELRKQDTVQAIRAWEKRCLEPTKKGIEP